MKSAIVALGRPNTKGQYHWICGIYRHHNISHRPIIFFSQKKLWVTNLVDSRKPAQFFLINHSKCLSWYLMRLAHETCLSQVGGSHTGAWDLPLTSKWVPRVWGPPACERQVSCTLRMRDLIIFYDLKISYTRHNPMWRMRKCNINMQNANECP